MYWLVKSLDIKPLIKNNFEGNLSLIMFFVEPRVKHVTCALKLLVSEIGDIPECKVVLCGSFSTVLNHVLALSLTHWGLFAPLRMTVSHCFKGFCIVMLVLNALVFLNLTNYSGKKC